MAGPGLTVRLKATVALASAALAVVSGCQSRADTIYHEGLLTIEHTVAYRGHTVVIKSSPGGQAIAAYGWRHTRLIIDGVCESTCAYSLLLTDSACFTERAVVNLHAPSLGKRVEKNMHQGFKDGLHPGLWPLMDVTLLSWPRVVNVSQEVLRTYYPHKFCSTTTNGVLK